MVKQYLHSIATFILCSFPSSGLGCMRSWEWTQTGQLTPRTRGMSCTVWYAQNKVWEKKESTFGLMALVFPCNCYTWRTLLSRRWWTPACQWKLWTNSSYCFACTCFMVSALELSLFQPWNFLFLPLLFSPLFYHGGKQENGRGLSSQLVHTAQVPSGLL